MTVVNPQTFGPGFAQGVLDQSDLATDLAYPQYSTETSITATASGTQSNSFVLSATVSNITTVASGNDGVVLPLANVGAFMVVANSAAANTAKIFAMDSNTINGTAGATGVTLTAAAVAIFFCPAAGKWVMTQGTVGGAGSFTTLTASGATTLNGTVELGNSTADAVGFYGVTGVTQLTSASQAAVGVTGATSTTPFGYTTSTQANAIVTLVNELRADLVSLGLIKGS